MGYRKNTISNVNAEGQERPNVPNLRFSQSKWYKAKLGDVCVGFDYGLGAEAMDYDGTNKYIRITDIDDETSKYKSEKLTSPSFIDNSCIVNENDILFARTGASTGKTYLYQKNDGLLYFAGFLIRANVSKDFNPYFVFLQTKTNKYLEWVGIMSCRSGQPGINAQEYKKLPIYLTDIQSQNKVANFFRFLDTRIETQSKIIEDLELVKKAISNHIFSDSSTIKKSWNLVKLANILYERKEYETKDSAYPHATLSKEGIYAKTDRYNRDFLVKDEEKAYKITHLNDICYNPANLKFGVICLNTFGDAIFSPIYVTYEISNDCDPIFIVQYLTNSTFLSHIRKYEQGTVYERMAVSSEDFLKGEINLPELAIQQKISKIFISIDSKIELEKSILEKYKEQKKFLLSNMFI